MTKQERAEHQARIEALRRDREQKRADAYKRAQEDCVKVWEEYAKPATILIENGKRSKLTDFAVPLAQRSP